MKYASLIVVFLVALVSSFFKLVEVNHKGRPIRTKLGVPVPTKAGRLFLLLLLASFLLSIYTMGSNDATERRARRDTATKLKGLDSMLSQLLKQNDTLYASLSNVGRRVADVSTKLDTGIATAGANGSQHGDNLPSSLTEGKGKIEIELDRFSRLLQHVGASIQDSVVAGNSRASARGFGLGSVAEYERQKSLRPLEDLIISGWDGCEFKIRSLLAEMNYELAALENNSELKRIGVKYKELFGQRDSVVTIIRGAIKRP